MAERDDRWATEEERLTHGHEVPSGGMGETFRIEPLELPRFSIPDLEIETNREGTPRLGGMSTPFMGGNLGFEGSYQRDPERPEWGAEPALAQGVLT